MQTKYYKTWEQYQSEHPEITDEQAQVVGPRLQSYEERLFAFIMFLCV